jgi:hypothetical protein
MVANREHVVEQLLELVRKYCQQRNLFADTYIEGMTCQQPLDEATIATLIRYHQEWLNN